VRIKMAVAADGKKARQCSRCATTIAHKEVTK
jgi:hypothetical protein